MRTDSVARLRALLRLERALETVNFAKCAVAFQLREHLLLHRRLVLGRERAKRRLVAGVVFAQAAQVGDQPVLLLRDARVIHAVVVALLPQTHVRVLRLPAHQSTHTVVRKNDAASGCAVECRTCNREVAGSNLGWGYFTPRSNQPSIPPGSVNDYQLRQSQVQLIPLADKTQAVQVKL